MVPGETFYFVPVKIFLVHSIPEFQEFFFGRKLLPFSIHKPDVTEYIKEYSEVQFKIFKRIYFNTLDMLYFLQTRNVFVLSLKKLICISPILTKYLQGNSF